MEMRPGCCQAFKNDAFRLLLKTESLSHSEKLHTENTKIFFFFFKQLNFKVSVVSKLGYLAATARKSTRQKRSMMLFFFFLVKIKLINMRFIEEKDSNHS